MVIGIIGESCTGKSSIAKEISKDLAATIISGKDYLRFAKNEAEAKKIFIGKLVNATESADENIIFVISEKEHLGLLPEKAFRVLVTADLDKIKERFAVRMHGNLPGPVAKMLEAKHGIFDKEKNDIHVVSGENGIEELCADIMKLL